jgi:hypothetical protein
MMACMFDFLETNYPLVDWIDLGAYIFNSIDENGIRTIKLNLANWPSDVYSTPPTQTEITNWHNS